jgi:dTDP-4-dehydrorhamnose reductase
MLLITGANGQVGQCFQRLATQYPQFRFLFSGSADLDIGDKKAVKKFFKQNPDIRYCVNCAAYTAVDKAESEPDKAHKVNAKGPKNLAEACAERGIPFLHLSTDYVYHNRHNTPLQEHDPVSPKSVYARTKLAGERAAQKAHPRATILRTSWVYAPVGNNFVKTMLRLGKERASLNVVFDQIGTPTYAPDLVKAILDILEKVENKEVAPEQLAGIWHYSNEGVASWYDFAVAVMEIAGLPCIVHPIETKDYPTPAQRPPFSVLNKGKIKAAFGVEIPHWRESLGICLRY